jgi:hypothetical protein
MIREIIEKIAEPLKKWAGKKTGSGNLEKTSPQVFPLDEQSFKKIRKKNFLYVDNVLVFLTVPIFYSFPGQFEFWRQNPGDKPLTSPCPYIHFPVPFDPILQFSRR